ncbi:hypothetical protein EHO59_11945 [Leptospira semungkisensis]|uniref:Uncharacterized protein n=1 Tax=Leptospira semungkisensis TaxID=2484985 RepID=A0A4R9FQ35_9LEPT|nr:hypothetical protein [Leptospira semungkisensis]TGK00654.1 hypothetical protein EHO59_11945 [Leptospira semungkisensis]
MEKLRTIVYSAIAIIVLLIVFTLLKSWFVYDRGIEIAKTSSNKSQTVYVEPDDDLVEHSAVAWGRFLFYPLGLNRDRENFGVRKTLNHAQNLVFVDLQTGRNRKVFTKSVYIWDYFYGAEPEKSSSDLENPELLYANIFPGLKTGKKFVIIGMPEDTNKDGYLNQKDSKKVFVYDPALDELAPVLPKKYYLEKILPDSPENKLVMIVKREEEQAAKKKPNLPTLFIYDTLQRRGQIVERP